ncbi:MAG: rane protein [candidate division NC10 bacterium]|nr:rane protein [candidate division NC10 bacterium]
MWAEIKNLILEALNYLYGIVGDYGVAIILLTVGMRILLMPLTMKQTKSMYEMQRIQPKIKELQKKYKDDKPKLQEETLKFYQENKVNPFGGCLPLVLQMPVFIALFQVLAGKTAPSLLVYLEQNNLTASFLFILEDITKTPKQVFTTEGWVAAIPYVTLGLLFALSVWLPQQLMPGDKQQKMIGLYMAIMMLWFGWISPAGVLLYWVTSSAWQIAQQQILIKSYARANAQGE